MAMANTGETPTASDAKAGHEMNAATDAQDGPDAIFLFVVNGSAIFGGQTLTIPAGTYNSNVLFTLGDAWSNVRTASYTTTGGVSVGQYAQRINITGNGSLTVDMYPYHQTATFYFEVL